MYLLPANLDFSVKYSFIMNSLGKALTYQDKKGWDIKESLKFIINTTDFGYTNADKQLAQLVLSAIQGRPEIQEEHFRIH